MKARISVSYKGQSLSKNTSDGGIPLKTIYSVSSGYEEEGRDDGNLLAVEELPVAETAEEAEKFSRRMRRK